MIFSKKPNKLTNSSVFLTGKELDLVTEFKYLGVILDSSLIFKKHINKISKTIIYTTDTFKHHWQQQHVSAHRFCHILIIVLLTGLLLGKLHLKRLKHYIKELKIFARKLISLLSYSENVQFLQFCKVQRYLICLSLWTLITNFKRLH